MSEKLKVGDSMELLMEFGAPFSWSVKDVEGAIEGDYQAWVEDLADKGIVIKRRKPRPRKGEESTGIPLRTFTRNGEGWRHYTYWEVERLDEDSGLVSAGFYDQQTSLVPSGLVVTPVALAVVLVGFLVLGIWATYLLVKEVRVIFRESGAKVVVIAAIGLASLGLLAAFFWKVRPRAPTVAA